MIPIIEQATGVYIGLLLLACLVGALTKFITQIPYTVALTIVGLGIALSPFAPPLEEIGFSRELILFVMLPPLLFQGSLHLDLGRLLRHIWPILTFASLGLIIAMFVIGGLFYWVAGVSVWLIAVLFGAMVTPTDPVSVLAIFKECNAPTDLRYMIEGESLFNDGVGIVVFHIILAMIVTGEEFHTAAAVGEFLKVAVGGLILGIGLGYVTFLLLRRLDDHLLENALCFVLAYGAFWLGEHTLHVSGVIATVAAGLVIGNYGKRLSMDKKTTETVETFFESIDFLINSFLFILIGLELQAIGREEILANLRPLGVAIVGLLLSRAIAVYPLYALLNKVGTRRPREWVHVMYWGGLRGSIPIALLLGLPRHELIDPWRSTLLVAGFGLVLFSLVFQGLTMKLLLKRLGLVQSQAATASR